MFIADVNAEMGAVGGVSFQDEVAQSARKGRFRVSAPAGPPETKLGRFRLMPSGKIIFFMELRILNRFYLKLTTVQSRLSSSEGDSLLY